MSLAMIAMIARILKPAITFCILGLFAAACRHTEPEKHSTEAEIRRHIVGEWMVANTSDEGCPGSRILIGSDGGLTRIKPDGARELVGTWKLQDHILEVDTVKTNYATFDDGRKVSLGTVLFYPVVFASEHELVCTPGNSMAGRLRFTR